LTIIYKSIIGRVSIAMIDYQNGNSQTRHVFFFSGVSKISCGLDGLQPYTLMLSLFEIGWVCHISYHKLSVSKRGINKPPSQEIFHLSYCIHKWLFFRPSRFSIRYIPGFENVGGRSNRQTLSHEQLLC
jgi:hypothetical protein